MLLNSLKCFLSCHFQSKNQKILLIYNYFLFCHPEMFKAVYLYEKSLLWHTIWVGYALGPKVHKKKFWWSYDTPNAKSVTFCESTYVFLRRPVADKILKWLAGQWPATHFSLAVLEKTKAAQIEELRTSYKNLFCTKCR